MKKILICMLLCLCFVLTLAACKDDGKKDKPKNDTSAGDAGSAGTPDTSGDPTTPDDSQNPDEGAPVPPDTPDKPSTDPTTPDDPQTPDNPPSTPTDPGTSTPPPATEVPDDPVYKTRVQDDEVALSSGVRLGMSFEDVRNLIGYTGEKPTGSNLSFEFNNILYTFVSSGGALKLDFIKVNEAATDAAIFRGIKIGENIESVFKKIPARDTELKKWAVQYIYGWEKDDPKGYADLEFIALSYYQLNIYTKTSKTSIIFSRIGTNVKWVEMYAL